MARGSRQGSTAPVGSAIVPVPSNESVPTIDHVEPSQWSSPYTMLHRTNGSVPSLRISMIRSVSAVADSGVNDIWIGPGVNGGGGGVVLAGVPPSPPTSSCDERG